jgi:hypothetical protein
VFGQLSDLCVSVRETPLSRGQPAERFQVAAGGGGVGVHPGGIGSPLRVLFARERDGQWIPQDEIDSAHGAFQFSDQVEHDAELVGDRPLR